MSVSIASLIRPSFSSSDYSSSSSSKSSKEESTSNSSIVENGLACISNMNFDDNYNLQKEKIQNFINEKKTELQNAQNLNAINSTASATTSGSSTSILGTNTSSASPQLIQKFNENFKGVLAGKGDAIASAATKYGLDPVLLASIMALETGWGTSSAIQNHNNPGGVMDPSTGCMTLKHFNSLEEGIDYMAKNLKNNYIDQGLTTISAIGNKYCPVGAANDPNGTNGGWIPSVTSIYNKLKV